MCLKYKNLKIVKYGDYVVGFKTFRINKFKLKPVIYQRYDYKVWIDKDSGDYVISSEYFTNQSIDLEIRAIDIKNDVDELWFTTSFLKGLGLHSYLDTNIEYRKTGKKLNIITLIVLIKPQDIQLISNNEIVSRQVIIPNFSKYRDIVARFKYNLRNKHKLESEFNIDFEFIDKYYDEKFYENLKMVYQMLNEIIIKGE